MQVEGPRHVATIPCANPDPWWRERHAACQKLTLQDAFEVAFLGDSITQGWEETGKSAWDRQFSEWNGANFGFSADRTEQVLFRLLDGEILGSNAQVVVIVLGTNNVGHGMSTVAQTVDGLNAILDLLLEQTSAKLLLQAILPRSELPTDTLRQQVRDISAGIAARADGKRVMFKDYGDLFLRSGGVLRLKLMPDALHLSPEAYEMWAEAMAPDIKALLP